MSYHVKLSHLIGDKPVPYELPCELIESDGVKSVVKIKMAADGMSKTRTVAAEQIYFKLESV